MMYVTVYHLCLRTCKRGVIRLMSLRSTT
ncbi:hypothetical protein PUN28_017134 [Cardiocondyla obscurior]|uniref:Uncharacterized protein n=1 Tax=Cardiocondyla obscurior TaxID=286306 RepID=A0AAW2EML0_9HYME